MRRAAPAEIRALARPGAARGPRRLPRRRRAAPRGTPWPPPPSAALCCPQPPHAAVTAEPHVGARRLDSVPRVGAMENRGKMRNAWNASKVGLKGSTLASPYPVRAVPLRGGVKCFLREPKVTLQNSFGC